MIENDLNFLIKNYDNIPQAYNLLKQKLIIVLENRDFLEKTANKLTKINKTKKFLDYSLVLSLQGNLKNLRKLLFENNKLEEEQNLLEEKFKNLIQINGNVFNDLNTYLINLDYIISEKEQKKS